MNNCNKCGEKSLSQITIFTETNFGQGDSTHKTYVKCKTCGNESASFGGYGFFNDKGLREAQADWNKNNPE